MEEKKQIRITFTAFVMIIISVILITAAITSVIILGSQAQKENELLASNEVTNKIDRNESRNHVDNGAVYVPPVYNEVIRENSNYVSNVISNTVENEIYEEEPEEEPEKEPYVEPSVNAPSIDNIEEFVLYYYDAVTYAAADFDLDWDADIIGTITNYDEVMKNLFTENGKKIYEQEEPLLYFENGVACMDAGDDHYDETLVDLQVKDIKREENKVTAKIIKTRAIAPTVFTDDTWEMDTWERKTYETEFIMVKENGKWLVDYFEWHDYLYE